MATLKTLPFDPVRFECRACGRSVEIGKGKLFDRYGDLTLPEIRLAVARDSGCDTAGDETAGAPPCGIVYSDLVGAGTNATCCGLQPFDPE